jgi:hypothetical protein
MRLWAGAKLTACPHFRRAGMGWATRAGHGGMRSTAVTGWCAAGGFCVRRRSGCGRTFSVLLATVLSGFVVRTSTLWPRLRSAGLGPIRAPLCTSPCVHLSGVTPERRRLDHASRLERRPATNWSEAQRGLTEERPSLGETAGRMQVARLAPSTGASSGTATSQEPRLNGQP